MRVLGFFLPIPFYGLPCRSWGPDCLTLSLSVDDAASCDGPISPNEAHAALLGMPKSKSPGSDGLPMEFYVAFLDLLGWDLVNVFNSFWRLASCLSLSMRRSLPLIFKGDHLDHKNCRPISPLNVDYKLCARVLARRLLKVIATVVSPDQTCGVPGRCIGENGAFLRDVIERANKYNPPVAPLFWIRRRLSPLPVLSLYADDTSAVLCRFEQGTGAKLNLGKCEGV